MNIEEVETTFQVVSSNNEKRERVMNAVACIISNSGSINVVINGKPYTIGTDHANYNSILKALKDGKSENIVNLVDIPKSIETYTDAKVSVNGDSVLYNGAPIHNSIADRILDLMRDDMPFRFMVNFLNNLMDNVSFRAVNELYDFLEFANIPITDDGCFLAYKRVRNDYTDIHSGTISNKIGEKPFMLRNMVDEDKSRTCSAGLHFCSLAYISQFGSCQADTDRVMIIKINPADVVAIPADYNNTKGRCCKYEVVAEYEGDWKKDAFTQSVYNKDGSPYQNDHDDDGYEDEGDGYDENGYDRDGYDDDGYDSDGYDRNGYDRDGYDDDGYDDDGYDENGLDVHGYDAEGYDREGYDASGYDADGYDGDCLNADGYDREGYDADGYDADGLDRSGCDEDGNRREYNAVEDGETDEPSEGYYNVRNAKGQFVKKSR